MGIQAPAALWRIQTASRRSIEEDFRAGKSSKQIALLKAQTKASDIEKDDPSARPFDKEKDIRGPTRINHAQRRELLNKSSSNI
ncbi:hypothetical protein CISG_02649 [Coccidioides immitis RMSCC 3703]|uniref:DUF3752 domain-containing protein n=1 Tax=Coccidioides immitis RMSCC 3703 TaxID=454286 RepID=A0A0J8U3F4_COCIT|nr:hypothetical protein CISG_02649 [Coccidioides immitis RMSCC 3703]